MLIVENLQALDAGETEIKFLLLQDRIALYYVPIKMSVYRALWASLMAQMEKNLPAMPRFDPWFGKIPGFDPWIRSQGWEDPLEKGMATHSRIFAWRIPWIEEPGQLHSMGSQRVGHD